MSNILLEIRGKGYQLVREVVEIQYHDVDLHNVLSGHAGRGRRRLTGYLLHVKKPSQTSSKVVTRIRSRAEFINYSASYHRMLYIRCGTTMCVIIVHPDEIGSVLHLEGKLTVGNSVTILDPTCTGYWKELPVLSTKHPIFPGVNAIPPTVQELPEGQLGSGNLSSFCINVDRIEVVAVNFQPGCNHHYCDARYGLKCPRSCSDSRMQVLTPQVDFHLPEYDITWEPYTSRRLGLAIFPEPMLMIPVRKDVSFIQMGEYMKAVLEEHRGFRIMGWFRPEVRDQDIVTETFKLHTSAIEVLGERMPRYEPEVVL